MYPSQMSFLFLTRTFILGLLLPLAIAFPCRAHSSLTQANRRLSRNPIVFSTPDLTGNGRPDDRQGGGASHLSRRN
ncbi:MAG: hypothetical protein SVX43_04780 [Cyanobacteriota bacterium]|nr:hypothetical protein [Cyanobacteriota bacterium]